MEAASLGRGGPASIAQSLAEAARARSRAFWIVAGITAAGAILRFATLGVQSYHHDEIVTASRILRDGFGHAMEAVGFSESAPPLYYVLAWLWTQVTGTGEVGLRSLSALAGVATIPVVYLIGLELRGRRAGLMAAALAAANPMLLWYSQEGRAYALLALLCSISLLCAVRALRRGERRDLVGWGVVSALALATHYFAIFPVLAEAVVLLRRRGRASFPGLWIPAAAGALLAPLALHQMAMQHVEWIANLTLGHRLWETAATFVNGETGDIIGRPEHPAYAVVPLALAAAGMLLLFVRGSRQENRAASLPLLLAVVTVGFPLVLALIDPGKDFVLARNLIPALVPLLVVVAIGSTVRRAGRLGPLLGFSLLAYSLGFCVWASVSPQLQRPDWHAVAERLGEAQAPRATVTWALGEAPLRYYLSTGAIQVRAADGYPWLVHEEIFVSDGKTPPPPRRLVGPQFREAAREDTGRLFIRRFRLPGPGLAPLRLRRVVRARLDFRSNGVLLDGVGPG